MKNLKEKLEIDMLKEMTYTDINKLLNELNTKKQGTNRAITVVRCCD